MFLHWAGYFPLFIQVKELNHYLEAEKSCRTDLEMYVAVLNTQKSVLQEDAEKLRKELHEGTYVTVVLWLSSTEDAKPRGAVNSFIISYLNLIKRNWEGAAALLNVKDLKMFAEELNVEFPYDRKTAEPFIPSRLIVEYLLFLKHCKLHSCWSDFRYVFYSCIIISIISIMYRPGFLRCGSAECWSGFRNIPVGHYSPGSLQRSENQNLLLKQIGIQKTVFWTQH